MARVPRTCRPSDSLQAAANAMWDAKCGFLPVTDDRRRPIGALTDRDVCMAAARYGVRLTDLTVEGTMSRDVRCCLTYDPIDQVEHMMETSRLRRLLVVDRDGALAGVITLSDISREARGELMEGAAVRAVPAERAIETFAAAVESRRSRSDAK